jgi:thymidylate synthase
MQQYLSLVQDILEKGEKREDRTGVGTISIFGAQRKYDLREGFPLLTTKKMNPRNIIVELLWFLRGDTNIKYLVDREVHIWDEWPFQDYLIANKLTDKFPMYSDSWTEEKKTFIERIKTDDSFAAQWGDLGPVYGKQWRRWQGPDGKQYDQIAQVIEQLKRSPNSRRILVSAWNVADVSTHTKTAPPLCHTLFQFYVAKDNRLDLQLYQRSADTALGVPYNIASYAALLTIIAQEVGLTPGIFTHTFGDVHIYLNHVDGMREQLTRKPYPLPKLTVAKKPMAELTVEDFVLENYQCHPFIKFQIAV